MWTILVIERGQVINEDWIVDVQRKVGMSFGVALWNAERAYNAQVDLTNYNYPKHTPQRDYVLVEM
jgi:hypothetical protein